MIRDTPGSDSQEMLQVRLPSLSIFPLALSSSTPFPSSSSSIFLSLPSSFSYFSLTKKKSPGPKRPLLGSGRQPPLLPRLPPLRSHAPRPDPRQGNSKGLPLQREEVGHEWFESRRGRRIDGLYILFCLVLIKKPALLENVKIVNKPAS